MEVPGQYFLEQLIEDSVGTGVLLDLIITNEEG